MSTVIAGEETCPPWAPLLGFCGSACAIIFANWGAAWGTWKSGIGLCNMSIYYPSGIIKNLVAIVMAGVLAIYGLIVAIIISGAISSPSIISSSSNTNNNNDGSSLEVTITHHTYSQYNGWAHLCAGLCCGLTCLAAGGATGIAGEIGILSTGLRAQVNHNKSIALRTTGTSTNSTNSTNGHNHNHPSMLSYSRIVQDEGDAGKLYIASVTILSFSGAIGLYGFIIALIITSSTNYQCER